MRRKVADEQQPSQTPKPSTKPKIPPWARRRVRFDATAVEGLFPPKENELTRLSRLVVVETEENFRAWTDGRLADKAVTTGVALVLQHPGVDALNLVHDRCHEVVIRVRSPELRRNLAAGIHSSAPDVTSPRVYVLDDVVARCEASDIGWSDPIAGAELHDDCTRQPKGKPTAWSRVRTVDSLLDEPNEEYGFLVDDLLAKGCLTSLVAPAGTGKTQLAMAMAVALAKGESFLGRSVQQCRVLYLDRDNPKRILRRRFARWGAAGCGKHLHYLGRDDAPPLTDRAAWQPFPFADYDLLIMDSHGSFSEGIEDKDSGGTSRVLAPLLDIARRSAAILLLDNTGKSGAVQRGSGLKRDRADIVCEMRDATGFTPDPRKPFWWHSLPEPDEASWGERAYRRSARERARFALVYSKFRLDQEPEPFAVEVRMPAEGPWDAVDITTEMETAHEEGVEVNRAAREAKLAKAADFLAIEVANSAALGHPLSKSEAQTLLTGLGDLTRQQARDQIALGEGTRWRIEKSRGKGGPLRLHPFTPAAKMRNSEALGREGALSREFPPSMSTKGGEN